MRILHLRNIGNNYLVHEETHSNGVCSVLNSLPDEHARQCLLNLLKMDLPEASAK